jgi:hypothetical protein
MTPIGRATIISGCRRVAAGSLAIAGLLSLASCGGNSSISPGPGWRGDQFAHEVANRPEQYVGQRLSITGPVKEVYSKDVFTLGAGGEILVVNPYDQPVLPEPAVDEQVTVSGDLRPSAGESLEPGLRQKLDAAASAGGGSVSNEGKPILVARGIQVLEK